MYKLKQRAEDFVVKEISTAVFSESGKYLYVVMKKRNKNTLDVVKELADILGIREKQIGFAGSKDKNALTEQLISLYGVSAAQVQGIKVKDVELTIKGYGPEPISLGDLAGNEFEITVRNVDVGTAPEPQEYISNYFDEQRFGSQNVTIGKLLIQKKFKEAVILVDDPRCEEHLVQTPNDAVGALKRVPIRLLRLYVNAYQSYLWNETVSRYLRATGTVKADVQYSLGTLIFVDMPLVGVKVPLVGFSGKMEDVPVEIQQVIDTLLDEEGIHYADFIIKQIPELTLEGELRKMFVRIKELQVGSLEDDDLNVGKKKILIRFTLGKGSYATMVVRALMESNSTKDF